MLTFAMPEVYENWLGRVNSDDSCARETREIGKLWNPLRKTVPSECSFIWNKGPVNIRNDRKARK